MSATATPTRTWPKWVVLVAAVVMWALVVVSVVTKQEGIWTSVLAAALISLAALLLWIRKP